MNVSNDADHTIALSSVGRETLEVYWKKKGKKAKAKLMFKVLGKLGPESQYRFTKKCEMTNYNLQDSDTSLHFPQPRTNKMKKSFMYDGAIVWNSYNQGKRGNVSHYNLFPK